jgi:membrane-bound serine protease (ClpP class)
VAELEGPITPVSAEHMAKTIERAEREGHSAVLIVMDTPGGLDTSMREIVRTFLNAPVPVIVWVSPPGARAASAGAVIVLASHVAAMAPGTNIGAATPVGIEGGDLGDKIVNDATAYVVAIAERTGRDTTFARDIVRKGRSEPASRAERIGAVDLVEAERDRLLRRIDGREVEVAGDEVALRTRGATVVTHELGFISRVRQRLADPNLALLFMSIGTLAIIYELANPGMGLGGIAGAILLVLALFALSVLPVNAVGVVLLVLALGLFIGELFVPGIGVMAAGGTVALVLAGLFLVRGDQRVALTVLVPTALVMFGAVMVATRLVWRGRNAPSLTGSDGFRGRTAEVRRADGVKGSVFLDGAWWSVRSSEALQEGSTVSVTDVDGLELIVESIPMSQPDEREQTHE